MFGQRVRNDLRPNKNLALTPCPSTLVLVIGIGLVSRIGARVSWCITAAPCVTLYGSARQTLFYPVPSPGPRLGIPAHPFCSASVFGTSLGRTVSWTPSQAPAYLRECTFVRHSGAGVVVIHRDALRHTVWVSSASVILDAIVAHLSYVKS